MSGKAYAFVAVPSAGSKSIGGCGRCDEDSPAAIERHQLQQWVYEGAIEWWEHRDDMPVVLASETVVTLTSYREGLPKVLLEAAACGKPIVAADVPGCREVVRHHVNGLLVPPKNPAALAEAIGFLLDHPAQRAAMGVAAREIVVQEYSVPKVAGQMLDLYRELLGQSWEGRSFRRNV
jgi:glycosyltransferase involved in cell wall biosynthesis